LQACPSLSPFKQTGRVAVVSGKVKLRIECGTHFVGWEDAGETGQSPSVAQARPAFWPPSQTPNVVKDVSMQVAVLSPRSPLRFARQPVGSKPAQLGMRMTAFRGPVGGVKTTTTTFPVSGTPGEASQPLGLGRTTIWSDLSPGVANGRFTLPTEERNVWFGSGIRLHPAWASRQPKSARTMSGTASFIDPCLLSPERAAV